jgi:hypothetical protein
MKNMQSSNSGFILTSISYSNQKREDYHQPLLQPAAETKRVITKYDYCLPPEEIEFSLFKK